VAFWIRVIEKIPSCRSKKLNRGQNKIGGQENVMPLTPFFYPATNSKKPKVAGQKSQ